MVFPELKVTIIPLIRMWVKKVDGLDNLPKEGAFILASNHASYMDHLIIGTCVVVYLNRKFHFLAKKEHFQGWFQRMWHNYAGAIPIDRQAGGKKALRIASKALKDGKIIIMYPEGTRTLTGQLNKGKTGVIRLALMSKVPIIPVGIKGTFEIMPKGNHFPKLGKASIFIGKPITFEKYYGKKLSNKMLHKLTDEIMKEIAKLSKQKYNPK